MTPDQYEAYVARVVGQLDCCKYAKTYRNRRYEGVRQPGKYEIDIAFEMDLSDTVFFRLIVECKNWRRPVTRPVIQNLAQTRDAIAAHKAAVVSPVGFTKEAIDVARVHGIALWVIAKNVPFTMIIACRQLSSGLSSESFYRLRTDYLESLGFRWEQVDFMLTDASLVRNDIDVRSHPFVNNIELAPGTFIRPTAGGDISHWAKHPFYDSGSPVHWLVESLLSTMDQTDFHAFPGCQDSMACWQEHARDYLAQRVESPHDALALKAVTANDLEAFLNVPGQKWPGDDIRKLFEKFQDEVAGQQEKPPDES